MQEDEQERNEALVSIDNKIEEPAMLYCPVCSRRLTASHCKLICEDCGYFMSCSDYY
jgi:hypothetical protein